MAKIAFQNGPKADSKIQIGLVKLTAELYGQRLTPDDFQNFVNWINNWSGVVGFVESRSYFFKVPDIVDDLKAEAERENQDLILKIEEIIREEATLKGVLEGGEIVIKLGRISFGIYSEEGLTGDAFHDFIQCLNGLLIVRAREGNLYTFIVPSESKPDEVLGPLNQAVHNNYSSGLFSGGRTTGETVRLHINQIAKVILVELQKLS